MIGLEKGHVQVVPHHPSWRDVFEQERRVLQEHIGGHVVDIQHVGSTEVPGLEVIPIIDSAIASAIASPAAIPARRQQLCALGYIDRNDAGVDGGYLFVKVRSPEVRTHHLHVVAIDDPQWRNYLRFRDMLGSNDRVRIRYGKLKKTLQEQLAHDREVYTD